MHTSHHTVHVYCTYCTAHTLKDNSWGKGEPDKDGKSVHPSPSRRCEMWKLPLLP